MSESIVARRYALAVYELLKAQSATEIFAAEVGAFSREMLSSDELAHFFLNPTVQKRDKITALELSSKGMHSVCARFLVLLAAKGRLGILDAIVRAYENIYNDDRNRVVAQVRCAFPLDDKGLEEIRQALAAITRKEIEVQTEVDETLIGGVCAQIGSVVYDGSLRGHLDKMKDSLVKA
ncbi:ATP synthase F1 subunit delta [Desulfurispirillum indicum]|uniref:ATP synthase subunit delta n=1 Tax=Desulfurispirillum indicum (strain ATCC BAA-1389 / DSM 22839 / S5) TaxID=653733 RepID=E6W3T5_DESIS|nr:ATP synthase F1 subunit delta [Desulfurispirillum indicum]ADU66966.1 ATP synthase F1, delta subunit [Desulfurispirillum indicum S5]UCZ56327.1 ATP synthase F1 subunit delta [Desulfurispirillum indicum]